MARKRRSSDMMVGIKKIVVPVRGDGKGNNVLRHAAVLAHRFDAHIDVTHVRAEPEDMIPFGVAVPEILKRQILEIIDFHDQTSDELFPIVVVRSTLLLDFLRNFWKQSDHLLEINLVQNSKCGVIKRLNSGCPLTIGNQSYLT